jgi:uncharacterized protein (TIGR02453 family)
MAQIHPSALIFLDELKENNQRDWFNANKTRFQQEQELLEKFANVLLHDLNTEDVIETPSGKKSLYRIYRDTRFGTDKTPYKTHWSGSFKRAGKQRRGGYYFHVERGNSFVGGGFWGPETDDLKRIREEIAHDAAPLRNIINSKQFTDTFENLKGEQLKTTPKGFESDHPDIDLLRYKQFLVMRRFTDAEVLSAGFAALVGQTFKNMRPFFDYMSEVLSTDANGLPL